MIVVVDVEVVVDVDVGCVIDVIVVVVVCTVEDVDVKVEVEVYCVVVCGIWCGAIPANMLDTIINNANTSAMKPDIITFFLLLIFHRQII